jgi:preprotein translocase subunit SecF
MNTLLYLAALLLFGLTGVVLIGAPTLFGCTLGIICGVSGSILFAAAAIVQAIAEAAPARERPR